VAKNGSNYKRWSQNVKPVAARNTAARIKLLVQQSDRMAVVDQAQLYFVHVLREVWTVP